jgi:hypothetical protein
MRQLSALKTLLFLRVTNQRKRFLGRREARPRPPYLLLGARQVHRERGIAVQYHSSFTPQVSTDRSGRVAYAPCPL